MIDSPMGGAEVAWLGEALSLLDQQVKSPLHLRAVDEPCHRSDYASKRSIQVHVKGDAASCLGWFSSRRPTLVVTWE